MKEIRTRPKDRDIQTRQTTAFLPKQAAKVLRENAARRQLTGKNTEQQEEAQSMFSEPASRFDQRTDGIPFWQGAGAEAV